MEPGGAYRPRPRGARLLTALPALGFFLGAALTLALGLVNPRWILSVGPFVLFGAALLGVGLRWALSTGDDTVATTAPYDLVIFDCDGVLVDSEVLSVEAEAHVLTELGWPITPAEVARRWMGRTAAEQLREVAERLGADGADRFASLSTSRIQQAFDMELQPVRGVAAVLDRLDERGVRYCIASSGTPERIGSSLATTGLSGRFGGRVFSSTQVEQGKPAPDLFLFAAGSLGVSAQRCAVVEDSVYGVRAGVVAGMTVFGYAGALTPAGELASAGAVVFHDMVDLPDMLTTP